MMMALLKQAVARLEDAGKESAALDARLLLQKATGLSHEEIICAPQLAIEDRKKEMFESYLARRLQGEPVSRILGRRSFWKLELAINQKIFDPRFESELLVETALARHVTDEVLHVLDLGTGSGCLLLSLLSERPTWRGVGLDCSPAAVQVARRNARTHHLSARSHFLCADWNWRFSGAFDLVLCNPPYIAAGDIAMLAPEVRDHDPVAALDGGADGLDAYRRLAPLVGDLMKPTAALLLEIGAGQADAVLAHFTQHQFIGEVLPDLSGTPRAIYLERRG